MVPDSKVARRLAKNYKFFAAAGLKMHRLFLTGRPWVA